ncbi:MAG: hypothetical protein WC510_05230 [Candidatus Omnitrophota bacterium]
MTDNMIKMMKAAIINLCLVFAVFLSFLFISPAAEAENAQVLLLTCSIPEVPGINAPLSEGSVVPGTMQQQISTGGPETEG